MFEPTLKYLNFLKQYILGCTFFIIALVFSEKESLLSKMMPRYLCLSSLSTSSPLIKTGSEPFFFDFEKSITISLVLEVFRTKKILSHQSTKLETSCLYTSSKELDIIAHWLVSSANLISGHDGLFCLLSAVYKVNKKG